MSIFSKNRKIKETKDTKIITLNDKSYHYHGDVLQNDIVRASLRPITSAASKLAIVISRNKKEDTTDTPLIEYLRKLLLKPSPVYNMQKILEIIALQRTLFGNAYVLIIKNSNNIPIQLQPLYPSSVKAVQDCTGTIFLQMSMLDGTVATYKYDDIIHLRRDNTNSMFGSSLVSTLQRILEVSETADYAVQNAINNANAIRILLKFNGDLSEKDKARVTDTFIRNWYGKDKQNTNGVAYSDNRYEVTKFDNSYYVPDKDIYAALPKRIYNLFGVSENIINNSMSEDEYNNFYETVIEPIARELAQELATKFLTPNLQQKGYIVTASALNLINCSMSTKLALGDQANYGRLSTNEWRTAMGLSPIPDGDEYVKRLDAEYVKE